MTKNIGIVKQIIGPVVDVEFPHDMLAIYNALEISQGDKKVVLETQQHIGSSTVRAIALASTDGLKRGEKVVATGSPVSVPDRSAPSPSCWSAIIFRRKSGRACCLCGL